jgi:hypothetical protein
LDTSEDGNEEHVKDFSEFTEYPETVKETRKKTNKEMNKSESYYMDAGKDEKDIKLSQSESEVVEESKDFIDKGEDEKDIKISQSESEVVEESKDLIDIKNEGYTETACSIQ